MSQENVETIRERLWAAQQAFNKGDFERAFATVATDVEWHFGSWVFDAPVLRSRAEVVAYYSHLRDTAGDWRVEVLEVLDAGEREFVVHQRGYYEGRTSKITGEIDSFQVWELGAEGLVTRMREYQNAPRPSKPWVWRSRRCRGRTTRSSPACTARGTVRRGRADRCV